MDKRVLWICLLAGSTVGGLLPEAWGGSPLGVASLLLGGLGGVGGLWVAVRISDSL